MAEETTRMGEKHRELVELPTLSTVVRHFGSCGLSTTTATAFTHPLDVLKVRLQMQLIGQRGPLIGMGNMCTQILRNEGFGSLYSGLTTALVRSIFNGGLRLSLYEPSKAICEMAFGSSNLLLKIVAGGLAGSVATALTNPGEVLKVRLQMNLGQGGAISHLRQITSQEGVIALWKGVGPAVARASTLNAVQLATYDEAKQALTRWTPIEEGFGLHLMSSTIAGVASTLATAPIDMVKTRLMLQNSSSGRNYRNGFHCAYQVLRSEGFFALYKGGFATFARLGPNSVITFVVCEKLRELSGLKAM